MCDLHLFLVPDLKGWESVSPLEENTSGLALLYAVYYAHSLLLPHKTLHNLTPKENT